MNRKEFEEEYIKMKQDYIRNDRSLENSFWDLTDLIVPNNEKEKNKPNTK